MHGTNPGSRKLNDFRKSAGQGSDICQSSCPHSQIRKSHRVPLLDSTDRVDVVKQRTCTVGIDNRLGIARLLPCIPARERESTGRRFSAGGARRKATRRGRSEGESCPCYYRAGGGVTPAVLSHHRTNGAVSITTVRWKL